MTDDVELLTCPFCGPGTQVTAYGGPPDRYSRFPWWTVICAACGSRSGVFKTRDATIAGWNRRAPVAEGLALLDNAWHIINAEGGYVAPGDEVGKAYCEAIEKALAIIESLGGMDPAKRREQ